MGTREGGDSGVGRKVFDESALEGDFGVKKILIENDDGQYEVSTPENR